MQIEHDALQIATEFSLTEQLTITAHVGPSDVINKVMQCTSPQDQVSISSTLITPDTISTTLVTLDTVSPALTEGGKVFSGGGRGAFILVAFDREPSDKNISQVTNSELSNVSGGDDYGSSNISPVRVLE